MAKDRAPKVEVVSEGPPARSLVEIVQSPPKLELAGSSKLAALSAAKPAIKSK